MTYTITPLRYATQQVRGPQVFFQGHWDERIEFAFYVFLIRGHGVTAVVDCGLDDPTDINEFIAPGLGPDGLIRLREDRRGVAELLAAEGVALHDVDVVALTHFHSDHVGNVAMFPRARFLLSRPGWDRHQRLLADRPQMVPDPVFPAAAVDFLQQVLEERVDLVEDGPTPLPGVHIKHVGGHTADSAAFTVETEEGTVAIPGDTIWTYANLRDDVPVGAAVDIAECYAAMDWARAADLVLPTHDPLVERRHPRGVGR